MLLSEFKFNHHIYNILNGQPFYYNLLSTYMISSDYNSEQDSGVYFWEFINDNYNIHNSFFKRNYDNNHHKDFPFP